MQLETLVTDDREVKAFTRVNNQDIILFCGSPGAGKSTFYWKYLKPLDYERVNQDTLKTVRGVLSRGVIMVY